MKIFLKIILVLFFSMNLTLAETFNAALKRAYETNPELNAERESLNISKNFFNIYFFNRFCLSRNF